MRIDNIYIENFRQFSKREVSLHPNFNLIIGENGLGKTSLLNAIGVALGGWAYSYIKTSGQVNLRLFEPKDVRVSWSELNNFNQARKTEIRAQFTTSVIDNHDAIKHNCQVFLTRKTDETAHNRDLSAKVKYPNKSTEYGLTLKEQGGKILNKIESGAVFNLPLLADYSCKRLWGAQHDGPRDTAELLSTSHSPSRFDPYKNWFNSDLSDKSIMDWVLRQTLKSLQLGTPTHEFNHIQAVAGYAIEGCSGIEFDIELSRIVVMLSEKNRIFSEHLSDGQRMVFGLFLDIAHRICLLNPHLNEDALNETEGIVLIDELDLHLHPKWQRSIINNLRQAFPKIQFICTTHSPNLLDKLNPTSSLCSAMRSHTQNIASAWIATGFSNILWVVTLKMQKQLKSSILFLNSLITTI